MKQSMEDFYKKHPMEICDLKRQYGTMSFDEHAKMVSYTYEANLPNIEERESNYKAITEKETTPIVGEIFLMKDGTEMRFSADLGDTIQFSKGGSFYMNRNGYCSFSGSLESPRPKTDFVFTGQYRIASAWFFDRERPKADNSLNFKTRFRVWILR